MHNYSSVSALPKGTGAVRYIQALCNANGNLYAAGLHAEHDRECPQVALTLKSIIEAGDTTTAGTLPLSRFGIAADFLSLLVFTSVVEKLKNRMFPAAFRVATPIEATAPTVAWVREGGALPLTAATFAAVTLDLTKMGSIVVLTDELVKRSSLSAEAAIRRILTNALGYATDQQFLGNAAAIAEMRPAGITNGITPVVQSGTTAAAITGDLQSMLAAMTSWRDPVWIMQPKTFAYLNTYFGGTLLQFAGAQPLLLGLPVFTSVGSPQQITLVDIASIAIADENGLELSVSRDATLEMDSEPSAGESSPITSISSLKSMFQNNEWATKIIRWQSWKRTIDAGVSFMLVNY